MVAGIVAILLVISGCTTVRDNYLTEDCEVPILPTLPNVEPGALSDIDDRNYWILEERERLLVDWAFDMESRLEAICNEH